MTAGAVLYARCLGASTAIDRAPDPPSIAPKGGAPTRHPGPCVGAASLAAIDRAPDPPSIAPKGGAPTRHPGPCVGAASLAAIDRAPDPPSIAPKGGAPTGWLLLALILLVGLYTAIPVNADEIRPALLDIKEQNTGLFAVTWKVPTRGNRALAITPQLPVSLELVGSPIVQDVPGALIEQATYKNAAESLTGQTIIIDGLSALQTDVLLLVQLQEGTQHSAILRPASPAFTIPLQASKLKVAGDYWRMGTIHILEGMDHLLFVLVLLLIVSGLGPLIKAVTAFTVAHSITLALATLGVVHVPSAPTEAIIALSILFLAAEIIHQHNGIIGITERYPWVIAFIFGLFHGLGFAGALSEIGVPQHEVPLALLMFNVGVETGQLLFIAAVLSMIALLKRLPVTAPQGTWRLLPYSIGGIAAYWTIDRVLSFMPLPA